MSQYWKRLQFIGLPKDKCGRLRCFTLDLQVASSSEVVLENLAGTVAERTPTIRGTFLWVPALDVNNGADSIISRFVLCLPTMEHPAGSHFAGCTDSI